LTGKADLDIERDTCSDEVIFLEQSSKQVRGLKVKAIQQIKKIAKEKNFKLCIAHRVKPTYIALIATNLPVVSVHHNYNDYSKWSRRILVNLFKDRILMLGVSNAVRDDLRRDLKGWKVEKIQTLYNRIDIETSQVKLLTKESARNQLDIKSDAWVFGTAGRLHHDKDYPTLIRAFASALQELPLKSLLVIMGKGPLELELKALANELGINHYVKFLGHISNGSQYFKAFDTFVLASNHEPFGMVLLEAMVAAIPIICSDGGGGAEVVGGVGELFEFGNVNQLKIALVKASSLQLKENAIYKIKNEFSDQAARKRFALILKQSQEFEHIEI
jgi:glycosyltransferase involved in cell wall biosynthesis